MWAMCALAGCAQGFDPPEASGPALSDNEAGTNGGGSTTAGAPGAGMGAGSGAGAMFTGDPCMMGQSESCACADGGEGSRVCRYDRSSPTQGSFSECMACASNAAGSGGDAGSGAGSGSAGTSGAGRSGSGGGSAGAGGSGGGGGGGR